MFLQMFAYLDMTNKTSSVISLGCDVENLTLNNGFIQATCSKRLAKLTTSEFSDEVYLYESTF